MKEMACVEAHRPQVVQKASRTTARISRTALTTVLGRQGGRLVLLETLDLLGGRSPGTVAAVPQLPLTVNFTKTSMNEGVRGRDKETEMKEILTSGGR